MWKATLAGLLALAEQNENAPVLHYSSELADIRNSDEGQFGGLV